MTQNIS